MTVRFNNNTNALSSDITLTSQGSPRASQRRAAPFSSRGGGEKGTEKMKLFVQCHPKLAADLGIKPRSLESQSGAVTTVF